MIEVIYSFMDAGKETVRYENGHDYVTEICIMNLG